jgi:hypothetical protein
MNKLSSRSPSCQDNKPCRTSLSGGACTQCGFPIAYAHPASLLDAFNVEAVWIGGTAIIVEPRSYIPQGVVRIVQRDGSCDEHPVPKTSEEVDVHMRRAMLLFAARLLYEDEESSIELSEAIVDGIVALSHGWLTSSHRRVLERYAGPPDVKSMMQTLLQEVGRRDRLERSIHGPSLTVDDNRPNLDVACAAVGAFSDPLSSIRVALLPGEADHVELYDVRIGERQDYPIGVSVISRLPGYGPEKVREIFGRVDIGGSLVGSYVPGAVLAGQLRDGVDASHPAKLSPGDLLEGVVIDLGRTFPPMSYVYLFYRVAPGHVFCAVVEPLP